MYSNDELSIPELKIKIKGPRENALEIDIHDTAIVRELKEKIANETRSREEWEFYEAENQRIIFNATELTDDDKRILDYNLTNGSVLHFGKN